MAPNKVPMEYITNDTTRKQTCKNRAIGVMKKADELSILCGVEACCIILPEGKPSEMQVWPSLPAAASTIDRFRSMPEVNRCKKKMDGADLVRERIAKVKEQLRRAERDNQQREATLRLHEAMVGRRPNLYGLTAEQLTDIGWTAENLIKKIKDRIADLGGQQSDVKPDPLPYAATVASVDAPPQGWVMEVLKAGCDLDAVACNGGSGGYVGDVTKLGNTDAGFFKAD